MIFYYLIKDTNNDDSQLYSIDTSCKQRADEIFISNFFPMLPNSNDMLINDIINICRELDYELTMFDSTKIICLK